MLLKNGYYYGKILGIEVKEYETKDKKSKFKNLVITVAFLLDNGEAKELKCNYGIESARDLFTNSGVTTADCIGKNVRCYVTTKSIMKDNEVIKFNTATSLRFIDENNNILYEPNKKEITALDVDF